MIDWIQGQTTTGNAASQHLAAMFGEVFLLGWSFGDTVLMVDPSMARPEMTDAAMARPEMVNPAMEAA